MILCAGCSWTYGYGLDAHETYPALLQNKINKKTVNIASSGKDIQHSLWSIFKYIKNYNADTVILQLTTLDRLTFPINGYENFLENKLYDNSHREFWYDSNDEYVRVNGISKYNFEMITVASYLDSIKQKDDRNKTVKYLNENSVFDNYSQDVISNQLLSLYYYLKSKKIKLIIFPWLKLPKEFFSADSGDELKELVYTKSVQEFIVKNNLEKHYLDKGFHLTGDGNKILVNDYVLPLLEQYD